MTSPFAARAAPRCTTHPLAVAPWRCTGCDRQLCEACTATATVARVQLPKCTACRAEAVPNRVPRQTTAPAAALPGFVRAIATADGLLQLAAIAFFVWALGFIPVVGFILGLAVHAAYTLLVIRFAAFGGERLPHFDDVEQVGGLAASFLRFLLGYALVWLPTAFYAHHAHGSVFAIFHGGALRDDPLLVLFLLLGLAYLPATLIVAAVSQSILAMLDPRLTLGLISRIPRPYLHAFYLWLAIQVGGHFLEAGAAWVLLRLPVPFLPSIAAGMLDVAIASCAAFVLGRLVFQHGTTFGTLRDEDLHVPVAPDAVPRGTLPPEPAPALPPSFGAHDALDLVDDADAADLRAALAAGDDPTALALWRARLATGASALPTTLEQDLALRLARAVAATGAAQDAARLCRDLAHLDLTTPAAGQALVLYARLLLSHTDAREQARAILLQVTRAYECQPCADEARALLSELEAPAA